MKVCLYYFSGTLNTEHVAKALQKEWGEEATLFRIGWPFAGIPDPNDYDLIGIGYPIHAFNTPKVVLDFFPAIPQGEDHRRTISFSRPRASRSTINDSSSRKLIHLPQEKRVCLHVQEFHYIMPYNIVFRHSDGMAKKMWVYAQKMSPLQSRKK
jgi:flavodoxin